MAWARESAAAGRKTASGRANDVGRDPDEQGKSRPEWPDETLRRWQRFPERIASCHHLLAWPRVAVELAYQGGRILLRGVSQLQDKCFNPLPSSVFEFFHLTEVDSV